MSFISDFTSNNFILHDDKKVSMKRIIRKSYYIVHLNIIDEIYPFSLLSMLFI